MIFFSVFEKKVHTSVVINAPIALVWKALSDFSEYNLWNSLVPNASIIPGSLDKLSVGTRLKIEVSLPQRKELYYYTVEVTGFEDGKFLQWLGHFKIPGLVDGRHSYRLGLLDENVTELIHEETFVGFLIPFVWNSMGPQFLQRFSESNLRLKKFIENSKL